MWNLLKRLYKLLKRREKILAIIVMALFFVTSLTEVFGLGFIFLYVKLILEPAGLHTMGILLKFQSLLGLTDDRHFLVALGVMLLAVLALKTFFGILSVWASMRFSLGRMAAFSIDLYRIYLFKDYLYFLDKNSATLKQNILEEIYSAIFNVMVPVLQLISEMMALMFIVLLLLVLHPIETVIMFASTGVMFGIYLMMVRDKLERLGEQKSQSNHDRHRLAADAFATIKETIVWDARWNFVQRFSAAMQRYSYAMAWHHVILQVPRYLIEAIGFFLIVGLIIHHLLTSHNAAEVVSVIALYGAAGMRMMPSFNRITVCLAQIRFHKRSLMSFYNDLILRRSMPNIPKNAQNVEPMLPFEKSITFNDVSFSYTDGTDAVIRKVTLVIHKRSSIAFVGSSGAGKSTLVDMLLGLIEPTGGEICVDGEPLQAENIIAWRKQIGYIPQRVFLLDDTVAANIAFGEDPQNIDMEQVKWACKVARIDQFIEQDLTSGYQTMVGEHGVRLSGGQAQRIAIARALYRRPSVLIMDEATAALDGITEREITETLEELAGKLTIVMIAHRLNTVKHCDMIYMLQKGEVVDWGTYNALLERNEIFRQMAS